MKVMIFCYRQTDRQTLHHNIYIISIIIIFWYTIIYAIRLLSFFNGIFPIVVLTVIIIIIYTNRDVSLSTLSTINFFSAMYLKCPTILVLFCLSRICFLSYQKKKISKFTEACWKPVRMKNVSQRQDWIGSPGHLDLDGPAWENA